MKCIRINKHAYTLDTGEIINILIINKQVYVIISHVTEKTNILEEQPEIEDSFKE